MIQDLKTYLNITWEDEEINKKLELLLSESKMAINLLMGVNVNYEELVFKELLFNRIRYAYNNSIEYFSENFSSEILALQLKVGVKELEKQNSNDE